MLWAIILLRNHSFRVPIKGGQIMLFYGISARRKGPVPPVSSSLALSVFAVFCLVLIFPGSAFSSVDVQLEWNANGESDLAGYRIFVREAGESYNYGQPDWEGTATSCWIYGLADDTDYFFVARAFDLAGNESGNSIEVPYLAPQDVPPIADAGPNRTVGEGATVTLDGSNSSDDDGSIVSYAWAQTVGTQVTLLNGDTSTPRFTAPYVGTGGEALTFQLTVEDNDGLFDTDTVIINVSDVNQEPTANAGPDRTVGEGAPVTLDGSNSSDGDGTVVSYSWVQTGGGTVSLINASSAQASFTAPDVGPNGTALTFQLTVTDNGGLQDTDTCIVNVSWVNLAPTANAGSDRTVGEGTQVTLNGSGSTDPDDGIASYVWTQTGGTGVSLSNPTSQTPQFTTPYVGTVGEALTFQLTVTDGGGLSDSDTVIINVSDLNQAPTADAGSDQAVAEGETVTLDGSDSSDGDGTVDSYAWTQTGGPSVSLSNPSAVQPSFTAPSVGPSGATLTFQLRVTDDGGLQSTDTCMVDVSWEDDVPPAPPGGFQLTGVQ